MRSPVDAARIRTAARATRHRARELDLAAHALALGAQQMLCTAPLLVAVASVIQREPGRGIAYATVRFFRLGGGAATAVTALLRRSVTAVGPGELVVSLGLSLVFSLGVGATQQRVFEVIWDQSRATGRRNYVRQVLWTVALGAFAIGLLAAARIGVVLDGVFAHPAGDVAVLLLRVLAVVGF